LWLLSFSPLTAQTFRQRGFLESRATIYPQKGSNDSAHAVGESIFRYEGFYAVSGRLQVAGGFDLRTDTHHQDERGFDLGWWDRETQRPMAAIRRFSAVYHQGSTTVELGKQFIRWGKTDILAPTDRFAPRDFLTVVDSEFLAVTAARVNFEKGSDTIEAVWSPKLTPSRIPLLNQRWAPVPDSARGIVFADAGANFPGGSQSGLRWNHSGAIEYELSLYQGFNHLPLFEIQTERAPVVGLERFYPKMLMAGGDVAVPARLFTLKTEAAHFSSSDPRSDNYGLYVVQLERQTGEWFFVGGYAGEVITKRGSLSADFAPDRGLTETFLGRAGYTIDTNRSVAWEAAARANGGGLWMKTEYSQAFGQHWRTTLNLTLIRGDIGDFLGQYRRNSYGLLIVRYSF
jgi:hypothetical protein